MDCDALSCRTAQPLAHMRCLGATRTCFFGYTLGMDLILKLVAGLMAGLRAYFLLAAAAVAISCLFFLVVFLVGLSRPSRAKLAGPQQSKNR
jgi:hypothetical protein